MSSSSDTILFTGPTLGADEARTQLDARYLPPVRYGDVYRAVTLFQPHVIGIIDGYFNQVPAVWHKEILWAMERGVRVYGAASMGALRAAELDSYGMQGVGVIYQAYREGRFPSYTDPFEDDDEVAVIHGPPELGFRPASEALVNIRATLASAARANIISEQTRDVLVQQSKIRFYAERTFETLLSTAAEGSTPAEELAALQRWLPEGRIDQKRQDALSLLRQLTAGDDRPAPAGESDFRFEHTTLWEHATREMSQLPPANSPTLDELRLLGEDFFALRENVLSETFETINTPTPASEEAVKSEAWHYAPMRDRQMAAYQDAMPPHWLTQRMLDRLAENNEIEPLERRAADKREKLAGRRLPHAADLSELEKLQLIDWYFSQLLGADIPDDTKSYATQLGDLQPDVFLNLVLQEYFYQHPET